MLFTNNQDGSLTISWVAPGITLHGTPTLNVLSPSSIKNNGKFPPADASLMVKAFIHLQFGTSTNNTIIDHSELVLSIVQSGMLTTQDSYINVNIPLLTLADPRAKDGIYAIGYIGIGWSNLTSSNTLFLVYDSGTNASIYQPSPPSIAGQPITSIINNNQIQISWSHASQGSAPIAGYTIKWSSNPEGPYPNEISLPITAYPLGTTNNYTYIFPQDIFPANGENQYFVVQAFDDGSAAPVSSITPANLINYYPPLIIMNAAIPTIGLLSSNVITRKA